MKTTYLILVAMMGTATLTVAKTRPEISGGKASSAAANNQSVVIMPSTVTVPAETEADIQMLSGIHSSVSHVGDPFAAQLVHPIRIGDQVALPAGSVIDGHITYIRPAGRLRRSAELGLRFDVVTLPNGESLPISALLTTLDAMPQTHTSVDSEGVLKGTNDGTWKRLAGGFVGLGAVSAIGTQIAGAAALGITLPVGGGAVLGFSFLAPKGSEVHVPPETQMRIRLRRPLTLRVNW